jgi:hypothetical protein
MFDSLLGSDCMSKCWAGDRPALGKSFITKKYGGGGGSRTRVRNPCQQRDSMLSRVPEISRDALRTDKMRVTLVR